MIKSNYTFGHLNRRLVGELSVTKVMLLRTFKMSKGVKNDGKVAFKQSFRTNNKLAENQNKKDFQEYIKKSQNKYVVAFPNLSKDTMLVIPMPLLVEKIMLH